MTGVSPFATTATVQYRSVIWVACCDSSLVTYGDAPRIAERCRGELDNAKRKFSSCYLSHTFGSRSCGERTSAWWRRHAQVVDCWKGLPHRRNCRGLLQYRRSHEVLGQDRRVLGRFLGTSVRLGCFHDPRARPNLSCRAAGCLDCGSPRRRGCSRRVGGGWSESLQYRHSEGQH